MGKESLRSGEFEIEWDKFYRHKISTFLEDKDEVKIRMY